MKMRPELTPLCTAEFERFQALINWAQSLGICFPCSIACACATVQREAGNASWGKPPSVCCVHDQVMLHETYCMDLYVANWKDAPRK